MAIIGGGSLAKLINDREGFTFFASGVGDSGSAVLYAEFLREHDMLLEFAGDDECLVYFSTISKFYKMSPYIRHKLKMETLVRLWFPNWVILNLGNIWECTNHHTFINAYKAKPYEPKDEYRYMISREQLNFITDNLPKTGKHEISIFSEMLKVSECLKRIK
jgi:hypothetical protein